jgi:hypothetical protein
LLNTGNFHAKIPKANELKDLVAAVADFDGSMSSFPTRRKR